VRHQRLFGPANFACRVDRSTTDPRSPTKIGHSNAKGLAVYTTHATQLALSAFMNASLTNSRPVIFHSDNGSEYNAKVFLEALEMVGVMISRSAPGCPWENGYQESFYSQFKVDLGDPQRFKSLGELVLAVYQTI